MLGGVGGRVEAVVVLGRDGKLKGRGGHRVGGQVSVW